MGLLRLSVMSHELGLLRLSDAHELGLLRLSVMWVGIVTLTRNAHELRLLRLSVMTDSEKQLDRFDTDF